MRLTIEIDGKVATVELPEVVVDAVKSLADKHGISVEQVIAQAVVNQRLLEDQVESGGELLVKKGDKVQQIEYA